jgi:hypothetical protein
LATVYDIAVHEFHRPWTGVGIGNLFQSSPRHTILNCENNYQAQSKRTIRAQNSALTFPSFFERKLGDNAVNQNKSFKMRTESVLWFPKIHYVSVICTCQINVYFLYLQCWLTTKGRTRYNMLIPPEADCRGHSRRWQPKAAIRASIEQLWCVCGGSNGKFRIIKDKMTDDYQNCGIDARIMLK